jgi:formylglycine-generating enzyme required for sulfatase activity
MARGAALFLGIWLWAGAVVAGYAPVVTNVQAKQRSGTLLVDITYDVEYPDGGTMVISVEISSDRGQTWRVPAHSFSGDVGRGIRPGTGKHIVWDAGADLPGAHGVNYRPRVIAEIGQGSELIERELSAVLPDGLAMDFVWIESGIFTMGAPPGEPGRSSDEGPPHQVEISAGFYLGKYEITQEQWLAVMGTRPWTGGVYALNSALCPAVQISWLDVQEFIHRLNEAAGDSLYRLPSEAEWEYACRAGTTTRWSFGNVVDQLTEYAWFYENAWSEDSAYAHEVGTRLSNPWGLCDMHGNVWEWCQDWFEFYALNKQSEPGGRLIMGRRIMRGGGFGNDARHLRSADRGASTPGLRSHDLGARLVRMR